MKNPNNQEVHHRNGDKYGSEMRSHKLAMERDFPVAVSKFRIGALKRAIATEKCLDNVKKHSEKLANIQEKLKPKEKMTDYEHYKLNKITNILDGHYDNPRDIID